MDETSFTDQSPDASPASPSLSLEHSSPWPYLSGLLIVIASIAGVVILSLKGQLADVPGWAKLVAIGWAGMATTERAKIASIAVRGWFRRK
jgi:hypothetical protein